MNAYVRGLFEGLVVYWDAVEEAALYRVKLYINYTPFQNDYHEIASIDVDRNIKYHSFKGLAGINSERGLDGSRNTGYNYYVSVQAEDRTGRIIDGSVKTVGRVQTLREGTIVGN